MVRSWLRLASLFTLSLAALACAKPGAASVSPDTAKADRAESTALESGGDEDEVAGEEPVSSPGEGELVSVRPGVNDRYFDDSTVESWTDKLERERREVIAHRDEIIAVLGLQPGMVVADIGAGTGAFMAPLSEATGAEGKLLAVDISPKFLAHLRERVADEGLANVEIVEGTATESTLAAGSVDLMFMCDVYHHIEYPAVYLRDLRQALAAEGRLVIVEFDKVPGKTSERMMKHVRQDKATLLAEMQEAGWELEREITDVPLDENYMLVFRKAG